MKLLLLLVLVGLSTAWPKFPTDLEDENQEKLEDVDNEEKERAIIIEEYDEKTDDDDNELQTRSEDDDEQEKKNDEEEAVLAKRTQEEEEAYIAYLENQQRLAALNLGAQFGPYFGFNLGGGLGPGQTGLGASANLGPLGFKFGSGFGLQQSGLGAGIQLGSLGIGASTGYGNGNLGLNANAGFGGNYLNHAGAYSQYARRQNIKDDDSDERLEEEEDAESKHSEDEAYMAYLENQKRLSLMLGGNLGSLAGFKVGGGLGPGKTGLHAGANLGPLGFKLGGGLGLRQTGLGGGVQLGPLGIGASTGFKNNNLGLNANAGFGGNYLHHGNYYAPLSARHIGAGIGANIGGLGAGVSAGIGNGGIGFNANAGFGNFLKYGTPAHYSQYYKKKPVYPIYGPWVPVQSRTLNPYYF